MESVESSSNLLVEKSNNRYSYFISYAQRDHHLAEKIYNDLVQHDVKCWFAPADVHG